MSVAQSLRTFLLAIPDQPITQVAQQHIPEGYNRANGFIWFGRRGTERARTFSQASGTPEQQFFDLEIYHPDIDIVEQAADLIHAYDAYRGSFGAGTIQGLFVDTQSDDYVQQVENTDELNLSSSFVSLEVRSYTEEA